jgi:hypothetical protein
VFLKGIVDSPGCCEGGAQKDVGDMEIPEGAPDVIGKKVACVERCWNVGDGYPTGWLPSAVKGGSKWNGYRKSTVETGPGVKLDMWGS